MTFNSIDFVVLLLLVLGLHWLVPARFRNHVVLAGSYAFYGWWDVRLLGLLVLSTVVDFTVARSLGGTPADQHRRRRALLGSSLVVNLGVLAGFKYAGFFLESLGGALDALGLAANPPLLQIVVPVGISFYTFQTLAYTIDVFRGRVEPVRDPVTFATYVAYFPQLVAGPIERAQRLMPQIADIARRPPTGPVLRQALSLMGVGLFKKVVLADGVAPIVNDAFAEPGEVGGITLAVALVGFAVQIYADFSGYSNMARGVSLLFGIELSTNFREPYLSRSITEFWQRWHISLSSWLRDYLYIPLGGNRGGRARTLRNLMLTMLLGGLWHGAAWTFVVWGGLHGTYLAIERVTGLGRSDRQRGRGANALATLTTFGLVTLTWTFFRAETLAGALEVLGRIASAATGPVNIADALVVACAAGIAFALDVAQRRQREGAPLVVGPVRAGFVTAGMAAAVVIFSGGVPEPFIYFQF